MRDVLSRVLVLAFALSACSTGDLARGSVRVDDPRYDAFFREANLLRADRDEGRVTADGARERARVLAASALDLFETVDADFDRADLRARVRDALTESHRWLIAL